MSIKLRKASVKFVGCKPLLFDRYTGSNEAKPEPVDKVYWHKSGEDVLAYMPQINIYSALSAENTKSVAKMYFGKKAKPIGMAINNSLVIDTHPILITQHGQPVRQQDFDSAFTVEHHVARINKSGTAIPNPKERPCLETPWELNFDIRFSPSGELTWEVMQQCFDYCGIIGLGTYRPLYGGFRVEVTE